MFIYYLRWTISFFIRYHLNHPSSVKLCLKLHQSMQIKVVLTIYITKEVEGDKSAQMMRKLTNDPHDMSRRGRRNVISKNLTIRVCDVDRTVARVMRSMLSIPKTSMNMPEICPTQIHIIRQFLYNIQKRFAHLTIIITTSVRSIIIV